MELDLVKQMFSSKDYANGMNYYRQGRVLNMVCNETPQKTIVSCYVRGSSKYFVQFYEKTNGQIYISCTCPRFLDVSRCKHIAAAMIAYVENPDYSHTSGSDRYVKRLLRSYLQMSQASSAPVQQPAKLVPRLNPSYGNHYPSFSFRVGYSRLYAVKNIQEFLCNVDQRKTTTYGKNLTLDHSIEHLSQKRRK